MNNEEKLEFIKYVYKMSRTYELLPKDTKEEFYEEWYNKVIQIIPKHLYKYRECNDNNLKSLETKTAWFSNPNKWNDPIDVTVKYNMEKDIEIMENNMEYFVLSMAKTLINQYMESFCEQKKVIEYDELKQIYYSVFDGKIDKVSLNDIVKKLTPKIGEIPARQIAVKTQEAYLYAQNSEYAKQITNGLEKFMGFNELKDEVVMCSLSDTYKNNHQWAVYADGGKGFCIAYKLECKTKKEKQLITNLLPIYYGDKKDLLITGILEEAIEYIKRPETLADLVNQESEKLFVSLYTKTIDWIGEGEWRFGLPKKEISSNAVSFDFAECIYLGENIEKEWEDKLIGIAREQKLKVYKRKLNSTNSDWIYDEVEI